MRGEKNAVNTSPRGTLGSPPHARGKGGSNGANGQAGGITPACAGKRICYKSLDTALGDHPRMRGEKKIDTNTWQPSLGSPPHARGKV